MNKDLHTMRLLPFFFALVSCGSDNPSVHNMDIEPAEFNEIEQPFRTAWFGEGHVEITQVGLDFLKASAVQTAVDANVNVDGPLRCDQAGIADWLLPDCGQTKLVSAFHVDNCRVGEAFASIRDRYRKVVQQLHPTEGSMDLALKGFGSILHTTQDFFAHTNWVDMGRTELVARDEYSLPEIKPGDTVGPAVWLAKTMPSTWVTRRSAGSRVPQVWDGASWRPGLISGTYEGNIDVPACVPEASIPHGDTFRQGDSAGSYLAKDDPDSLNHLQAVSVSKRQTSEEFCRLVRLATLAHGQPTYDRIMSVWVRDVQAYKARCPLDMGIVVATWTSAI